MSGLRGLALPPRQGTYLLELSVSAAGVFAFPNKIGKADLDDGHVAKAFARAQSALTLDFQGAARKPHAIRKTHSASPETPIHPRGIL